MKVRANLVLLIVSTSIFFEALDIAIVNLAMPLMQETFALTADRIQWVQTLYVIFYGGFLIIGGKLADQVGRKKVFMIGSMLFLITSFGAGFAQSYTTLLVLRAIQGLGAAFVIPSAFSIITNAYTDPYERNRAIGIFGSFAAIGSGSGLSVGGLIATYFGWQWIFFINVPVIGMAILLGLRFIPNDTPLGHKSKTDILSGVFLTLAILCLSYVVHELHAFSEHRWFMIATILLSIVMFALVAKRSHRENPLIHFAVLKHASVRVANGNIFLLGAFFTGYLFLISQTLQGQTHYSPAQAGFLLLPFSVFSGVVSKSFMPNLLKKVSLLHGALIGMALMATGGLALVIAAVTGYPLFLLLLSVLCVTGTGIAVCFMTLNVMAVQSIPEHHHGLGSSLATTSFFFGGGVGLSLLGLSLQFEISYGPPLVLFVTALSSVLWLARQSFANKITA